MSPSVTIIDYGSGNICSVMRAFEHCGATPVLTDDPQAIAAAERLVLPGVGAFADGHLDHTPVPVDRPEPGGDLTGPTGRQRPTHQIL